MKNIYWLSFFIFCVSVSYSQNWKRLDSLSQLSLKNQALDSALIYAEMALDDAKKTAGEKDTIYANMLRSVFEIYYYKGNYEKAKEYCRIECEVRKIIQGDKHPEYATTINHLGLLYKKIGDNENAEKLYLEAMEIRKKTLGEKHADYANSLNNLASLYESQGLYIKAEKMFIESMMIRKQTLGESHPDYAQSLNNLANIYYHQDNYEKAEEYMQKSVELTKKIKGEKDSQYTIALNNLAVLNDVSGNFSKARELYTEVLKIREKTIGKSHPYYALSLNNLGFLYTDHGMYSLAEPLYIEALKINEEIYGIKSYECSRNMNNLGALYEDMGNFPEAEKFYLNAKEILSELKDLKFKEYGTSLNNLAGLYRILKKYDLAEPIYKEAIELFKLKYGEKHSNYATVISNLACLYDDMNYFKEADSLYSLAAEIRKEVFGENHPSYFIALNNLGYLYAKQGSLTQNKEESDEYYKIAEKKYLEAFMSRKKVLGVDHPDYLISVNNLAILYAKMNEPDKACNLFIESKDIINRAIIQNFVFLSESEKELYFQTHVPSLNAFNLFVSLNKDQKPELTGHCYDNILKHKGLLLKSVGQMKKGIIQSGDTLLIEKYNEWIKLKKQISKLYAIEIENRKIDIEELNTKANFLEKELTKNSVAFSDFEKLQKINWESVKAGLNEGEAAVEFLHFPAKNDSVVYYALIITPDCLYPEMVKLFYENELSSYFDKPQKNNVILVRELYGDKGTLDTVLYKRIWQPLVSYIKNSKKIYYSPDGILHKISFAAIRNSDGIFLNDKYTLCQLSSTAIIGIPDDIIFSNEALVGIYGGIRYSTDSLQDVVWNYLPGTKIETDKINATLKRKNIYTEYFSDINATENQIKKNAVRYDVLHIATHGYFFPNLRDQGNLKEDYKNDNKIEFRGAQSGRVLDKKLSKNPLMRSGLVMAGANNLNNNIDAEIEEDGLLTALEVSQMDLSVMQLVVLSACETGLGDIKGSEGVYGLQRAFKMAGVKYIIMSLWQVPDKETVEFMEMFYNKLLKEKDVRLAFNETQKEMRKKYDPYYWGAFVLVE